MGDAQTQLDAMPDRAVPDAGQTPDAMLEPEADAGLEPFIARAIATCTQDRGWFITIKFDRGDPSCAEDHASGEFIQLPLRYVKGGQGTVPGDLAGYYFGRGEVTGDIAVAPFQLNLFDDDLVPWTDDVVTTGMVDIQLDGYSVVGPFVALACPPWRPWDDYPPCFDFPAQPD